MQEEKLSTCESSQQVFGKKEKFFHSFYMLFHKRERWSLMKVKKIRMKRLSEWKWFEKKSREPHTQDSSYTTGIQVSSLEVKNESRPHDSFSWLCKVARLVRKTSYADSGLRTTGNNSIWATQEDSRSLTRGQEVKQRDLKSNLGKNDWTTILKKPPPSSSWDVDVFLSSEPRMKEPTSSSLSTQNFLKRSLWETFFSVLWTHTMTSKILDVSIFASQVNLSAECITEREASSSFTYPLHDVLRKGEEVGETWLQVKRRSAEDLWRRWGIHGQHLHRHQLLRV